MNYTLYEDLFTPGTELQKFKFKNVSIKERFSQKYKNSKRKCL